MQSKWYSYKYLILVDVIGGRCAVYRDDLGRLWYFLEPVGVIR